MNSDTPDTSHLVLGTAQLGMDYGIANTVGKPDLQRAREIVLTAWEGGIRYFDTAQAYGNSERILGDILADLEITDQAQIITKPAPNVDHSNKKDMEAALKKSLKNLRTGRLYGLMLHREEFLDIFEIGLADTLKGFLKHGVVDNIGVSLYSPSKAKTALTSEIVHMLQVPANICDHRFRNEGVFALAKEKKAAIFIRSVFLQGLLVMDIKALPGKMQHAVPVIEQMESLCRKHSITKQGLALSYVRQKYPHAFIIIGAETQQQLVNNLCIWKNDLAESIMTQVDKLFTNVDEKIVNPTLWPR